MAIYRSKSAIEPFYFKGIDAVHGCNVRFFVPFHLGFLSGSNGNEKNEKERKKGLHNF
jgi:hypothetical protein